MADDDAVNLSMIVELWDSLRAEELANGHLGDPLFLSRYAEHSVKWDSIHEIEGSDPVNAAALLIGSVAYNASPTAKALVSPDQKQVFCSAVRSAIVSYDEDSNNSVTVELLQPLLDSVLPWLDDAKFVDEATVQSGLISVCANIVFRYCRTPRPFTDRNEDSEPEQLLTCLEICSSSVVHIVQRGENFAELIDAAVQCGGLAAVMLGASKRCCGPAIRASARRALLAVAKLLSNTCDQDEIEDSQVEHSTLFSDDDITAIAPLFTDGLTREAADTLLLELRHRDPAPFITIWLRKVCAAADNINDSVTDTKRATISTRDQEAGESNASFWDSIGKKLEFATKTFKETLTEAADVMTDTVADHISPNVQHSSRRRMRLWTEFEADIWVTTDEEASDEEIGPQECDSESLNDSENESNSLDNASYVIQLQSILKKMSRGSMAGSNGTSNVGEHTFSQAELWILNQVFGLSSQHLLRMPAFSMTSSEVYQCKVQPQRVGSLFNRALNTRFWNGNTDLTTSISKSIASHIVAWADQIHREISGENSKIGISLLETVKADCPQWDQRKIVGDFYIHSSCGGVGTRIIPVQDTTKVYCVVGVEAMNLADMFADLPIMARLTLLPFGTRIVYTGMKILADDPNVKVEELRSWLDSVVAVAEKEDTMCTYLPRLDIASPTKVLLNRIENILSNSSSPSQIELHKFPITTEGTEKHKNEEGDSISETESGFVFGESEDESAAEDSGTLTEQNIEEARDRSADEGFDVKYRNLELEKEVNRRLDELRLNEILADFEELGDPFRHIDRGSEAPADSIDPVSPEQSISNQTEASQFDKPHEQANTVRSVTESQASKLSRNETPSGPIDDGCLVS